MDIDKLMHALENDNNAPIASLDLKQIAKDKNDMLQQLHLPKEELKTLHQKLKLYRYVDTMEQLGYGKYIRWINLNNMPLKLTNGGILCSIKVVDEIIHVLCRNNVGKIFQVSLAKVLLFQKLSDQEQIILKAMALL